MSQTAVVLSFSNKFLSYTEPSLTAIHPDVIKSYQTAIDGLNERLKVLSEEKTLDQGFNICKQRSELFDEVLKDIFERTKNHTPPEGPVLLGARGGYGRSELTFSSDVDTCVIEDTSNGQDNTVFLKAFISNIKTIGHTIPELHDTPIVNSVHELMTLPLLIGNEKNGDNIIDIKKFLAMQDFRPLAGNFEIADLPLERLKNLAFENRAQLILYHIHDVRDRWTKHGEQAHHLDNFNIKNGFGGLRDFHFGLYAIAYQTKRSVTELIDQLLPAEKEAYSLLLHAREWMAHKRPELKGFKRDDHRHLSFGHDLVPRFEFLFGRDISGNGPINKLIRAREVAARFSDRIFARILQDGVKVSPNTNLKGLSSRDPSLGVVVAPDATRINQANILMELVAAASKQQLPIIADAVTLELICEVGDRIKPDAKILEIFGSSESPIGALKFLYQTGLFDKLLPALKSLSSTFYPEEHRLTTENLLDRALARIENLKDLYGAAALDNDLGLFANKFQKLTEVERSGLFCALLFEELPLVATGVSQQPNWDWTSAQKNLDSVIDQAFEPLIGNKEQITETKRICKEIIRNKFLLRALSKEMLPTSSNSLVEIEKQISDKKMASLLMLFSFAAFDYVKPENHPQARLSRQQWVRLVKLAEFLERQIGEESFKVVSPSRYAENGSLEMDILQAAGLLLSSNFGTKLSTPLRKLKELVISAPERTASSSIINIISSPDAQNESSLKIEVYTLDRKDLLSDMLVLFNKKGLTVRSLEAITFSLDHQSKQVAPVIDVIDLAVPKKQAKNLPDLIKELEVELLEVISSESGHLDSVTSTAIPEDDISAISLSQTADHSSLRLSLLTPKANYSKALNRIAWVISKQFNGNILMFNQDNRWGTCPDCEIVFIFKLDQTGNIQDLEKRILKSIVDN